MRIYPIIDCLSSKSCGDHNLRLHMHFGCCVHVTMDFREFFEFIVVNSMDVGCHSSGTFPSSISKAESGSLLECVIKEL